MIDKYLAFHEKYYKERWYIFLFFCLLSVLLLFLIYDVIVTDPKYYTGGNENSVTLFRNIWSGIYILYPFYSLAKFFVIAVFMAQIAKTMYEITISWQQIFLLITLSHFILLIPNIAQIIWFLVLNPDYQMSEVRHFYFLSVYNFLPQEAEIRQSVMVWLDFLNVSEILFWIFLIIGTTSLLRTKIKQGIRLVFSSYGALVFIIAMLQFCFYFFLVRN